MALKGNDKKVSTMWSAFHDATVVEVEDRSGKQNTSSNMPLWIIMGTLDSGLDAHFSSKGKEHRVLDEGFFPYFLYRTMLTSYILLKKRIMSRYSKVQIDVDGQNTGEGPQQGPAIFKVSLLW